MGKFDKRPRGRGDRKPSMHKTTCSECGTKCEVPFKPTGSKPVLCSACFGKQSEGKPRRYNERGGRRTSYDDKRMFSATCDSCGKKCEVPFKPTAGKPVYCSDCFESVDTGKKSEPAGSNNAEIMERLDLLDDKVSQILRFLVPAKSKGTKLSSLKKPIEGKKKTISSAKSKASPSAKLRISSVKSKKK